MSSPSPSIAVVTCVEAGYLEQQSIRMIESLRRWGGRMKDCPVYAITPRLGGPLKAETHRRYRELNVEYRRIKPTSDYTWYNFINKPMAMLDVERNSTADILVWLDADIIIANEPEEFFLADNEDFAACASDKNIGTSGPDDVYEPYWLEMCRTIGLDINQIPWTTAYRENQNIRAYFNGGVISWRRKTGYSETYLNICHQLLNAKFKIPVDGYFYHEQAAVGLAMAKLNLRMKALSELHNYAFGSKTLSFVDPEKFKRTKILHYHRSMRAEFWPQFLKYFETDRPDIHQWLSTMQPLEYRLDLPRRIIDKLIRSNREKRMKAYADSCRVIKCGPPDRQ